MNGLTQRDGMLEGQDGETFSYTYAYFNNRLVFVSYFDHTAASNVYTECFERAAA